MKNEFCHKKDHFSSFLNCFFFHLRSLALKAAFLRLKLVICHFIVILVVNIQAVIERLPNLIVKISSTNFSVKVSESSSLKAF